MNVNAALSKGLRNNFAGHSHFQKFLKLPNFIKYFTVA